MSAALWICATAALGIFGAILHSVATFASGKPASVRFRRNAAVEVFWALIPIVIVIAAALPSLRLADGLDVVPFAASE